VAGLQPGNPFLCLFMFILIVANGLPPVVECPLPGVSGVGRPSMPPLLMNEDAIPSDVHSCSCTDPLWNVLLTFQCQSRTWMRWLLEGWHLRQAVSIDARPGPSALVTSSDTWLTTIARGLTKSQCIDYIQRRYQISSYGLPVRPSKALPGLRA